MSIHRLHLTPDSRAGAWAFGLAVGALTMTIATIASFQTWLEAGSVEPFAQWRSWTAGDWLVSLWGFLVLAAGLAALGAGLAAIVARRDRALAVVAATGVGGLIGALMLQQVAEGLGWLNS